MKKTLCLLLSLVLVLGLAACGSKSAPAAAEPAAPAATESAAPAESPAPAEAPAPAAEPAAAYKFLDEDLGVESYAIGFRKGDDALMEQVSGAVKALVKNGTYDQIAENYPDIKDYLCLKAADISDSEIAAEGSGDSSFTFKHGFDLDYPPYSYLQDDGKVGGFDVELAQAVCAYLGWGYEPVPFNWDAKDAELNAGSCDCIWSGFTKEGREDDYCWGIVYSANTQGIMVPADSDIKTLADLAGKSVGVQTATSALDMLEGDQADLAASFGELQVYETYTIAFNDLKAGAIDAIAIDMTAGAFLIANDAK